MSYFDGIFLVNDVYQYRLSDAWPVDGYLDIVPTKIDPLFNLTKFATTGNFSTQLNQIGVGLTVLYPFNRDASTNNFNITVVGDAKAANFSPYTPGYYSAYFDGTDDYLNTPSSSALSFGTGDFTIEGWFYPTSGTNNGLFQQSDTAGGLKTSSGTSVAMNIYTSNSISVYVNGTPQSTGTNKLPFNVWTHLALVRYSGVTKLYINGVLETSLGTAGSMTDTANYSGTYIAVGGYYSTSYLWNGSISNFRVVKGTAVYTSNFTPPTAPLTAIANTSLLACQSNRFIDNSPNNFAVTVNGNTAINPTNPFTPNNSYSTYGSAYFDGTGDYLTVPAGSAFAPGVGDYTVEGWFYATASMPAYGGVIWGQTTPGTNYFIITAGNDANPVTANYISLLTTTSGGGTAVYSNSSNPFTLNTWNHFAVVRVAGTVTVYLNGIGGTPTSRPIDLTNITYTPYIGSPSGSSQYFPGYISNFRYVNGTAVYTSNFAPPTLPLTAVTNTSLLTLQTGQPHNNHTFLDRSNNKFLITRVGNTTQGTFSPYGGSWSIFAPANGSYLNTSNNIFNISSTTAVWTYESWVMPLTNNTFFCIGSGGSYGNSIYIGWSTNKFTVGAGNGAGSNPVSFQTNGTYTAGVWYHVAVTRTSAGVYTLYINGVADGTQTYNAGVLVGGTTVVINGVYDNNGLGNSGGSFYNSNMRFLVGTVLYTGNFTVPTAPLTAIANTAVLTCQDNRIIDNSPRNLTLTTAGSVSVQKFSPFSPAITATPTTYSAYLDNDGDYLSIPANAAFTFGTNDHTIEFYYYLPSTSLIGAYSTQWKYSSSSTQQATNDYYFQLGTAGGSNIGLLLGGGGSWGVLIQPSVSINTFVGVWTHIAWTRSGNTFRLFFNGVQVGTGTHAGSITAQSNPMFLGQEGAGSYAGGYYSNFRVNNGTALYTSNFTPPTAPLTAISGTSLLTCQSPTFIDNSTNNFTITAFGNSQPTTVNPFGSSQTLADYTPNVYGGSGYFDGTDYLTAPSNAAFTFGTRDFTVEGWFYVNSLGANGFIAFDNRASASAIPFTMGVNSSGNPYLYDGTVVPTGSSGITVSTWAHIAWVRTSGVLKMFVNGISVYSAAYTTNLNGSTATVGSGIGGLAGYFLNGYMSDFRFVNGTALYTSNFVPPIAPPTPSGNTSLMLNFTDAAVKDYTMRSNMESMADLKVSSVNSKFGGTSLYFDGTGDYGNISPVSNTLILGTGDFTAEMWINPYSNITTTYPMTIGSEAAGRYSIILVNDTLQVNLYGGATANLTLTGPKIPANAWSHIAVVRAAGNVRGYYNGNVLPNTQVNSSIIGNGPLRLGSDGTGSSNFFGYMDDVRITANARYTANFIPAITYLPTR